MTSLVILSAFGGLLRSDVRQHSGPLPPDIRLPVLQMPLMFKMDLDSPLTQTVAVFKATTKYESVGNSQFALIYELDFKLLKNSH